MKFSIVVPTYNEQNDIAETLDALVGQSYQNKEILIVDDSTDKTPDIIKNYEDMGVRLIRPKKREGRCGARNLGILEADGDVVVILNADGRLPSDFLEKIKPYYDEGYDYVLVKSSVSNTEKLFARFVDAMAGVDESGDPSWMEWTEGFSCRRDVAIKAGLFPVGYAVPICAGEDGYFGTGLKKIGAKKKVDFSIVVPHVSPSSLTEYWEIRKGRGKGSPQIRRFLQGWKLSSIILWAAARIFKNVIFVLTVIPVLFKVFKATRYSKAGISDLLPFVVAWIIEQLAFHVGEWQSIAEINKAEKHCAAEKI